MPFSFVFELQQTIIEVREKKKDFSFYKLRNFYGTSLEYGTHTIMGPRKLL
jgi:hypothetical protein